MPRADGPSRDGRATTFGESLAVPRVAWPLLGRLGLVCLAAAAALAWPRERGVAHERPALRAVVIDASAAVRRRAPGYASHLAGLAAREARRAQRDGEDLALALYDRGARWWSSPGAPDDVADRLARGALPLGPATDTGDADLAAALELVGAELRAAGRAPGSVLIVGDGTATGRDAAPVLAALARDGVRVDFEAAPPPTVPDARVHAVHLAEGVAAGAPLAAVVEWSLDYGADGSAAWPDARATLMIDVRDADGERVVTVPLVASTEDAPQDGAPRRLRVDLGTARAGAVTATARVRVEGPGVLRDGDPIPANDVARDAVRVGDAYTALAVTTAQRRDALESWLDGATPGLDWIVVDERDVRGAPRDVDLVMTVDLAPDALPVVRIESTLARGGGWFHAGGWSWLATPRSMESAVAIARLPLRADVGDEDAIEYHFLVDASGSMRGEPWAQVQRALEACLPLVPERDRFVAQSFSNRLGPRLELSSIGAGPREDAVDRVRAMQPSGGSTQILDCLGVVARDAPAHPAERARVVLLSDGREPDAVNVAARAAKLRDALRATNRTLSVVAAGPDADAAFLSELVGPAGSLRRAVDFAELTELFREEVGRDRVREGDDALARATRPATPAVARELGAVLRDRIAFARVVRAEVRGNGTVLYETPQGDAVLALGRADGGAVAALATDIASNTASTWGTDLAAEELAPVWRALAAGARRDGPRASVDGDALVIEGLTGDAPAIFDARLVRAHRGTEVLAAREEVTLGDVRFVEPVAASGADRSGRREAALDGALRAALGAEPAIVRSVGPALVLPVASGAAAAHLPEARRPVRWPVRRPGDPDPVSGAARPGRGPHPATPWVLGAGLLALFASAALRMLGDDGAL